MNGSRISPRSARIFGALLVVLAACPIARAGSLGDVIDATQPKMVKIYGAGGYRGLEAYQSGFLISSSGHVLTVWSYVLDTDVLTVVLDDGRKFEATLVGHDPRLEIAVLKVDGRDLPFFELTEAVDIEVAERVLAFSNLFGVATGNEPASVLKGVVSAKTNLKARRGVFKTTYGGPVYVLDAMTNNPGAAGGALTDLQGRFLGMLGKELRNAQSNAWLNYAIPAAQLKPAIEAILTGRARSAKETDDEQPLEPLLLEDLGIVLVPNVVDNTPPFIDSVRPDSPAARSFRST